MHVIILTGYKHNHIWWQTCSHACHKGKWTSESTAPLIPNLEAVLLVGCSLQPLHSHGHNTNWTKGWLGPTNSLDTL